MQLPSPFPAPPCRFAREIVVPEVIPNSDIEGRLIALREVVSLLLRQLPTAQLEQAIDALEALSVVSDGQEDPGAVASSAFAIEGARAKEVRIICQGLVPATAAPTRANLTEM